MPAVSFNYSVCKLWSKTLLSKVSFVKMQTICWSICLYEWRLEGIDLCVLQRLQNQEMCLNLLITFMINRQKSAPGWKPHLPYVNTLVYISRISLGLGPRKFCDIGILEMRMAGHEVTKCINQEASIVRCILTRNKKMFCDHISLRFKERNNCHRDDIASNAAWSFDSGLRVNSFKGQKVVPYQLFMWNHYKTNIAQHV